MVSTDRLYPVIVNIVNDVHKYFDFELFGINSYISKLTYFMFGILTKLIVSFGVFNIVQWLFISAFIWAIVHGIYLKCIKQLLLRIGVGRQDREHLSETIWELCFTSVSAPLVFSCVGGSIGDTFNWAQRLDYQLSKCKVHEDVELSGVKTLFVLQCSFAVYDLLNSWYINGFKNLEFLQKQIFLAVFTLTYYSKCPLLGLSLLYLLLRPKLVSLLSKLCCLLAHFTHSYTLTCVAWLLCGCNVLIWSGTYLYHIPMFLTMGKTIDSGMMKAEIKMLIVFDVMLWFYIITSLLSSIFSRIMLSLTLPSTDRPRTLEHFLFGTDPLLLKLTASSCKRIVRMDKDSSEEDESKRRKLNSRALIQTIHCSIVLKRKIRRMREEKERRLKLEAKEQNTLLDKRNESDHQ